MINMKDNGKIKLTPKQQRFCEEYLIDFNGTQAAIRAGYSEKTAKSMAWENLTKPYLKEYLEERMKQLSLTAEETVKLMSDIARSSLNDYLIKRTVEKRAKVRKHLSELIQEANNEIEFEQEYADRVELTEDDLIDHYKRIKELKKRVIRYEIELEKNPNASRIVMGEPELVETIEIDFVKLAEDKQHGKIKSLQWTEFGPKVELYPADKMLTNMANLHGLFTNKLQLLNRNGDPIDPDPLAPVKLSINVIDQNANVQQSTEQGPIQPEASDA